MHGYAKSLILKNLPYIPGYLIMKGKTRITFQVLRKRMEGKKRVWGGR
jgi:hypothetical protein